ncbi:MAG: carbonate dehydratase [Elusimicrobia bacterium]|nr:carbonate dehydratase [Elusimicrobiota bacterium]
MPFNKNPEGVRPDVHPSAYVDPTAAVIGRVRVGRDVFVGPGAVLRADEPGSSITVGDRVNVQDRVVLHALSGSRVVIEEEASLSHGCIVHGPCRVGRRCFVGFGSVVFKAELRERTIVKNLCCVEDAVVPPGRLIRSGRVVRGEKAARALPPAEAGDSEFVERVVRTNIELARGYNGKKSKTVFARMRSYGRKEKNPRHRRRPGRAGLRARLPGASRV